MPKGKSILQNLSRIKAQKSRKPKKRSTSRRKSSGEKKSFVLLKGNTDTGTVFRNKQPRGAALKAANRGHKSIRLRERGTNRIHVFTGTRKRVPKSQSFTCRGGGQNLCDEWTPKWRANVRKVRVERR